MHIFISYSRKDSQFADHLCELLNDDRLPYFIDKKDIKTGSVWREDLRVAVQRSFALIVIMTEASQKSDWVQKEIAYARERHIPIFPIVRSGGVWPKLEDLNCIEMTAAQYLELPDQLRDPLRERFNAFKKREARRTSFPFFYNKYVQVGAVITVALIMALGLLFWPDDESNDGDGTPISQLASPTDTATASDTPTPTITPTASSTPNSDEVVLTAAATILTATAHVEAVSTRVIEMQTQNAATNAYFQTGTASARQSFTPTDDGGGGGEPIEPSITPTPSATESATATPNWVLTAEAELSESLTPNVSPITPTRTPPRITRTPTPTPTSSSTSSPRQPDTSQPIVPTTPIPSLTPPSSPTDMPTVTSTFTLSPTPTIETPSATPTNTASPTQTASISSTPPTAPPSTALFDSGTPGIANNPSHVIIPVYGGPSYDSTIVGFLRHTQAISIMGEVPGWVFIGYGWVRFDRVFSVGDESSIPLFQTQVFALTPAPTTDEDFRALGYQYMTQAAETGGIGGESGSTDGLAPDLYQTFVAGETQTAMPTFTPTPTRTPTSTLTRTPTATRAILPTRTPTMTPSRTPSRTPTRTRTPMPITPTSAVTVYNPPQWGTPQTTADFINIRASTSTDGVVVGTVARCDVIQVTGHTTVGGVRWYQVAGGWISSTVLLVNPDYATVSNQCVPIEPVTNTPPAGPTSSLPYYRDFNSGTYRSCANGQQTQQISSGSIFIDVTVPEARSASITIRYSNEGPSETITAFVNEVSQGNIVAGSRSDPCEPDIATATAFPGPGYGWNNFQSGGISVNLPAGTSTIRLEVAGGDGLFEVDAISIN